MRFRDFFFFSFFGEFSFCNYPKEGGLNLYNRLGNAICIDSLKDRSYILKVFHALTPSIHCLGRYIEGLGMGCRQRSFSSFWLPIWRGGLVPLQTGSVLMGMKNPKFLQKPREIVGISMACLRGTQPEDVQCHVKRNLGH